MIILIIKEVLKLTDEVAIKYLDALMSVFTEAGQIPTFIRNKIKVLQQSMRKETQSADVSIPIKIQEVTDKELNEEE